MQLRLIRLALQVEIVQNNLRKEALEIIAATAAGEYVRADALTRERLEHIRRDREEAEEAISAVRALLEGKLSLGSSNMSSSSGDMSSSKDTLLTRAVAAQELGTTIDCLRNWEMNGLFSAKRKRNGYRVYGSEDIKRLRIIKILRDSNYSLVSIHRLLMQLDTRNSAGDQHEVEEDGNEVSKGGGGSHGGVDIRGTLDTPTPDEDIRSVCDKLLTSLALAEENSHKMIGILEKLAQE